MEVNNRKLLAEYETVRITEWWAYYHERIAELMKTDQNKCETDENVARSQGAVRAFKMILGTANSPSLAEKIINQISNVGEK